MSPRQLSPDDHQILFDILDASPIPVVAFDRSGLIDYVSPLVKDRLGFAPDELIGRPTEVLVPDRFAEGHLA